jgi:hypothetical protein
MSGPRLGRSVTGESGCFLTACTGSGKTAALHEQGQDHRSRSVGPLPAPPLRHHNHHHHHHISPYPRRSNALGPRPRRRFDADEARAVRRGAPVLALSRRRGEPPFSGPFIDPGHPSPRQTLFSLPPSPPAAHLNARVTPWWLGNRGPGAAPIPVLVSRRALGRGAGG